MRREGFSTEGQNRRWSAVAVVLLAATVIAASAQAGTPQTSLTAGELALRETETASLGATHAAEHAALRATALSDESAGASPQASVAAVSTDPAVVGSWTPKFAIPGVAVHAVMLHTGKILYFTGTSSGRAYLLDPITKTTRAVFPPRIAEGENEPANIFCAGQSFLDDGTVLVMGGTIGRREGLNTIYTFDPITETWRRQANMRHGRWYPTQVLLADGRTVVLDGLDEQGEPHVNPQIESYNANFDFVTLLSVRGQQGHPPSGGLYPHTFQMPSGRVLVAGPDPSDSWFFSLNRIGALSWEDAPNPTRHTWGTGALLPGGTSGSTRVALIGGVDRESLPDTGTSTPLPGVQTFDEANPGAGWTTAPPLNHGRAHHNTVQLPDRSMVTVGGGYGILNGNRRSGDAAIHRNIELYDATTGQWTLGPAQDELRTYHSTALLLPDGRVMSAGDDGYGGSSNDTAEIYEPPYLFKGARPSIASAPSAVTYGDTFTVQTSSDATKAVLMAPAAVTHANDMSQRHVPLAATVQSPGTLTVSAPARPELAPPTYYMLFVLNDQGVPSVAKFIRVKLGRADAPPPPPGTSDPPAEEPPLDTTDPETSIASGPSQTTTATSATFAFSSSEASSSFECRVDTGDWASCVSPATLTGLSAVPHTFAARAIDPAGNTDPSPAAWDWTVVPESSDTVAPETTIVTGPPVTTTSTSATFDFVSSEAGSTFECLLDTGNWTPCTSPTDHFFLDTAPHAFDVRATDSAGNTDQSPAQWDWVIASSTAPPAGGPAGGSGTTVGDAGPVGPLAASDSTPPTLSVLGKAVKKRRVLLDIGCPTEACTATAAGRVVVPGAARVFGLPPASAQIQKGYSARLKLQLSRKAWRVVQRALSTRKRVRVRVQLSARDAAGNVAAAQRSINLKR